VKLDALLTLQLRPHIAGILDAYVERVRGRMPEAMRARVTTSKVLRQLARRAMFGPALTYVDTGRQRDGAPLRQLRVRMTAFELAALKARAASNKGGTARLVQALIVDAAYPDGNYPANPDSKPTTKDAHHGN
jgi:hypothetical protein